MVLNFVPYIPGDVVAREAGEGLQQKKSRLSGQAPGFFLTPATQQTHQLQMNLFD